GLWTDGRYFVQALEQLQGTGYELVKLLAQGNAEYIAWITDQLHEGSTAAFDGRLMPLQTAQQLEIQLSFKEIKLQTDKDYLGPIWTDRPPLPQKQAFLLNEDITGSSVSEKLD